MKTIKGPAIFLAQFAGEQSSIPQSGKHCALGCRARLQRRANSVVGMGRLFDLKRAAESKAYCDEVAGTLSRHGLHLTELSTHLQGQPRRGASRVRHRV